MNEVPQSEIDANFRRYRLRVMLAITFGYGLLYTCRLALSIVKKPLIDGGIFTIEELGLIGSGIFFGYAFGKFVNGFLADYVKPRVFFAAGLLLSALINLSMGWSTIVWVSVSLWALNGWFQGFCAPSCVVSLTNWFSNHERGRYYGIWSASHSIGEGLTFFVIAAIVSAYGWQTGFWVPGVICILAAVWCFRLLENDPQSVGLPSVAEWQSDYWVPATEAEPEISIWATQRSIFKIRAIWILALSSALMYITRYAINSWSVLYLQEIRGYSLLEAGLFLTINTLTGLAGAVAFGFISDKIFAARRPPANLLFAVVEVVALLIIFFGPGTLWSLGIGFALYGAGLSGLLASLGGLFAVDIAPGRVAGAAMGTIGIVSYLGAALQETVSASLIESAIVIENGVRVYNFDMAIYFWVGSSVLSLILAASLWNTKVRD